MISKLADWVILFIDYYDIKYKKLISLKHRVRATKSHV